MALPFSLLSFLKLLPRGIAILYAVFLIFSSASVAIRENNPSAFFIDGIGTVLAGNDKELSDNMDVLIENKEAKLIDFMAFINVISGLLLFYYIVKLFHFALTKSFEMASALTTFLWAVGIVFLLQTLFYTATTGSLHIGYSGIFKVFLNLDSLFFPFAGWLSTIGQASIKSPFF